MSENLHVNQDEANKHTPKGFDLVGNNTRPWKSENGESVYEENMELPRAINFVDGTLAPPTSNEGDIYVIIGSGVLEGGWGASATFKDWVRFTNGFFIPITPVKGFLCYDNTAEKWKEFDGTDWVDFGGGGATNLSEGTATNTTVDVNSDTGTNATLQQASTSRAGVMSKAKFDEVAANNSKVTNATHSGDMAGATTLTAQKPLITGKGLVTADGLDHVLISDASDSDNLKKVLVSDFLSGGGSTNLGIANITATNLDVTSDTGTDATLPAATASDAGLMTGVDKTKLGHISVTQAVDLDTIESDTATNNSKVTNSTHSGDMAGATTLTAQKPLITGKALVTANGADHVLISDASDSDNLKKVLVSDFLGGGGGVSDGDKGDITVSLSGTQWDIDPEAVSYNKIQNVADQRLLGNFSGGVGSVQELEISDDLQVDAGVLGLNTNPLYISDITTVNLLDDVANWTSGNYTGTAITGTFQGQHHVNSTYWFTCTHDNIWIRMARI